MRAKILYSLIMKGFEPNEMNELIKLLTYPSVEESLLYEGVDGDGLRCGICERRCTISSGQVGFCTTRMNIEGKLYTLVYGDISSMSANPIEKKPFFHFWPGSKALTIGTWSCNFTCPWCQNYDISKVRPQPSKATYIDPETFVRMIGRENCQGCSISFNEPTLLVEYSLNVFPLARTKGLYNTFVSNGYMTLEALRKLRDEGMDAIKFDIKGDEENAHVQLAIWDVGGQPRFADLRTTFYRGANGALMVYDLIREETFKELESWYSEMIRFLERTCL